MWFWSGGSRRSERKFSITCGRKDSRSQKYKQVAGSRWLEREREEDPRQARQVG